MDFAEAERRAAAEAERICQLGYERERDEAEAQAAREAAAAPELEQERRYENGR